MADAKRVERRKSVESSAEFYVDSRACVGVEMDVSEWFSVNVGLGQGCVCLHGCLTCRWMVWCER